jgi:hypothetical protein
MVWSHTKRIRRGITKYTTIEDHTYDEIKITFALQTKKRQRGKRAASRIIMTTKSSKFFEIAQDSDVKQLQTNEWTYVTAALGEEVEKFLAGGKDAKEAWKWLDSFFLVKKLSQPNEALHEGSSETSDAEEEEHEAGAFSAPEIDEPSDEQERKSEKKTEKRSGLARWGLSVRRKSKSKKDLASAAVKASLVAKAGSKPASASKKLPARTARPAAAPVEKAQPMEVTQPLASGKKDVCWIVSGPGAFCAYALMTIMFPVLIRDISELTFYASVGIALLFGYFIIVNNDPFTLSLVFSVNDNSPQPNSPKPVAAPIVPSVVESASPTKPRQTTQTKTQTKTPAKTKDDRSKSPVRKKTKTPTRPRDPARTPGKSLAFELVDSPPVDPRDASFIAKYLTHPPELKTEEERKNPELTQFMETALETGMRKLPAFSSGIAFDRDEKRVDGRNFVTPSPTVFQVRQLGYNVKKVKGPSAPFIYEFKGMDLFKCTKKIAHIMKFIQLPSTTEEEEAAMEAARKEYGADYDPNRHGAGMCGSVAPWLVCSWRLPGYTPPWTGCPGDGHGWTAVYYWKLSAYGRGLLVDQKTNSSKLVKRWMDEADVDVTLSNKVKGIPSIHNPNDPDLGFGMVIRTMLSTYNQKPFLTRPDHYIYKGNQGEGMQYLEIDIDVHTFGKAARNGQYQFFGSLPKLIGDIALVLEADGDSELPEQMLGAGRMCRINTDSCPSLSEALTRASRADNRANHSRPQHRRATMLVANGTVLHASE